MKGARPIDPAAPGQPCPLTTAVDALGGKWNLICLYWLVERPRHFGELRRLMPGISQKVLTDCVRRLESNRLIARAPRGDAIDHVDYALTDYGRSVLPLIEAVRSWGARHVTVISAGNDSAESSVDDAFGSTTPAGARGRQSAIGSD